MLEIGPSDCDAWDWQVAVGGNTDTYMHNFRWCWVTYYVHAYFKISNLRHTCLHDAFEVDVEPVWVDTRNLFQQWAQFVSTMSWWPKTDFLPMFPLTPPRFGTPCSMIFHDALNCFFDVFSEDLLDTIFRDFRSKMVSKRCPEIYFFIDFCGHGEMLKNDDTTTKINDFWGSEGLDLQLFRDIFWCVFRWRFGHRFFEIFCGFHISF